MTCQVRVINLILEELTLVSWYWVPGEEPCNMLSQSIINICIFFNKLFVTLIEFYGSSVVMSISDVIMIRYVVVNSTVPRLWYITFMSWVSLFISTTIG